MDILKRISDAVWGLPMIILILAVGIYYSCSTRLIQLRGFKGMISALSLSLRRSKSAYAAFSTALAATVGTGSVVGVASALAIGGAGSVFWLWVSSLLGMAVAFAEGVLSIKYREKTQDGYKGGMMYVITIGLKSKPLALAYAFFATLACFGMGIITQTNSVAEGLSQSFNLPPIAIALAMALLVFTCSAVGSNNIGKLCSYFVPILSLGYIILTLLVIIARIGRLPMALGDIFSSALGLKPAVGGVVGYGIKTAISQGVRRGVFSNEAGLGTTATLHASSQGITPRTQGHLNMLEVAIDSLVICTLTALAVLCSDVPLSGDGIAIVKNAFSSVLGEPFGCAVSVAISLFALATAVGWVSVGKGSYDFLTRSRYKSVYTALVTLFAFLGGVATLDSALLISDIFNGLMALPCLTALILLRRDVIREA